MCMTRFLDLPSWFSLLSRDDFSMKASRTWREGSATLCYVACSQNGSHMKSPNKTGWERIGIFQDNLSILVARLSDTSFLDGL